VLAADPELACSYDEADLAVRALDLGRADTLFTPLTILALLVPACVATAGSTCPSSPVAVWLA
jgi:hypothetical protein